MTSRRATSSCSRPSSTASRRIRDSNSSSVDLGLHSPILGRHFRIPNLYNELPVIEFDDTLPYVPVYCHFTIPDIEPIIRPSTPPILKELRAEFQNVQLSKSPKHKLDQRSISPHTCHRHSNLSNRSN